MPEADASKVVLVTGASRGIGAATALLAAARGYRVCVNYTSRADEAGAVVKAIESGGGHAIAVQGDVANEDQVLHLFDTTLRTFGRLDALVNNAGVLDTQMPLANMTAARISRILGVNVLGTMLCAREALRHLGRSGGGRGGAIVNLSSVASRLGAANEYVDYAASKAAVDTFTIGLAREVAADGIRVNAVRPGIIETWIHATGGMPDRPQRMASLLPMQRPGQAEEVASTILWLLSDEASYVSGAIIDVAGAR